MVDFATHAVPFIDADIKVAFASVDSIEQTAELQAGLRVGFPMYAEADMHAIAASTGAFIQTGDRNILHATGFLLSPEGSIVNATYSTGPLGRMTPSDVLRMTIFRRNMS